MKILDSSNVDRLESIFGVSNRHTVIVNIISNNITVNIDRYLLDSLYRYVLLNIDDNIQIIIDGIFHED